MKKDRPVLEDNGGDVPEILVDSFQFKVGRDGHLGITFNDGTRDVITTVLTPEAADFLYAWISPEKRKEMWEMAKPYLDKGLN
jgi:hypothetical protein